MPITSRGISWPWRTVAASIVLLAFAAGAHAAPRAEVTRLTFLHFNDTYRIAPKREMGGFAGLMTLLARERRRSRHTITTHGGDMISPSVLSGLTRGRHMIGLMNAIRMDVAVLGNHEFDYGMAVLRRRVEESRFTWLATNVAGPDGTPAGGTRKYWVRRFGRVTVGAFGLVTPRARLAVRETIPAKFRSTIRTARAAVTDLRARGADVIVALTHLNFAEDRELARLAPGIHLILGGHDHVPIAFHDGEVLILKAGSDARYLAVADLDVTKTPAKGVKGRARIRVVASWRLIANYRTPPNPRIAAVVKRHQARLDRELGGAVGTTRTPLDSRAHMVRSREAAIGNLVADALRARMGADVALMNGGGIRGSRVYEAGHVLTRKDIVAELPFDNVAVLLEVSGLQLRRILEHGLSTVEHRAGRFPQVSGMTVTYDPSKPPRARIGRITVGGKALDEARTYRLATNDFMADGGDGYKLLKARKRLVGAKAGPLVSTAVMDYIRKKGEVAPKVEGRIVARQAR